MGQQKVTQSSLSYAWTAGAAHCLLFTSNFMHLQFKKSLHLWILSMNALSQCLSFVIQNFNYQKNK